MTTKIYSTNCLPGNACPVLLYGAVLLAENRGKLYGGNGKLPAPQF